MSSIASDNETETTRSAIRPDVLRNSVVIIPTYNEAENVSALVAAVHANWPELRILFIDDNSPDGTASIIGSLRSEFENIDILHRPKKSGLGSAYRLGIKHCLKNNVEAIFQMDADLSHDPEDLLRMAACLEDASVVVGSRYIPNGRTVGWSKGRKLISRLGSLAAQLTLNAEVHDMTSGFVGYRADALRTLDIDAVVSEGFAYQIEMKTLLQRAGCLMVEIPITFRERAEGNSKMHIGIIAEAVGILRRLRKDT